MRRGHEGARTRRRRARPAGKWHGERPVCVMINAPPEMVFGLYTDAGRVREWLSGVRESAPPAQPISPAVGRSSSAGGPSRWRPGCWRWNHRPATSAPHGAARAGHLHDDRPVPAGRGGTARRLGMAYRVAGGPLAASLTPASGTRWSRQAAGTSPGATGLAEAQTRIRAGVAWVRVVPSARVLERQRSCSMVEAVASSPTVASPSSARRRWGCRRCGPTESPVPRRSGRRPGAGCWCTAPAARRRPPRAPGLRPPAACRPLFHRPVRWNSSTAARSTDRSRRSVQCQPPRCFRTAWLPNRSYSAEDCQRIPPGRPIGFMRCHARSAGAHPPYGRTGQWDEGSRQRRRQAASRSGWCPQMVAAAAPSRGNFASFRYSTGCSTFA
jgi:hypothetical protein